MKTRHSRRMVSLAFVFGLSIALAPARSVGAHNHIVIFVDAGAAPGGDGSARFPYRDLKDAVAAADATPDSVLIEVRPGDYVLTEPLLIDRSLDLHGSTETIEGDDGWPTGDAAAGTEARIVAANPVGTQGLFVVGRGDASVMSDVSIRGFVFQGATNGVDVLLRRVQNYELTGNIFRAPAFVGMQSVASSGQAAQNYFSGVSTGAILNGGYPESPSSVVFLGNRSVRNLLGGLVLNGASIDIPELGDELNAVVRGNDLSDNTTNPSNSFGLRLFILRRDRGAPGDSQSSAHIQALVQDNRISGDLIGISIDAGFPYRSVGNVCDPRVFSGSVEVRFAGNTVVGSLLAPALVTFTRNTAALKPETLPLWQYLHAATFVIDDADGALENAWIDHPESDPVLGPCPGDATHESLGNVLIYNESVVPNGRNF